MDAHLKISWTRLNNIYGDNKMQVDFTDDEVQALGAYLVNGGVRTPIIKMAIDKINTINNVDKFNNKAQKIIDLIRTECSDGCFGVPCAQCVMNTDARNGCELKDLYDALCERGVV